MPRIIPITAVVDDGTPQSAAVPTPAASTPITVAYGEDTTVHLIARTTSGKTLASSSSLVVTYGARVKPAPAGQLLFKHVAVPTSDGGWNCPIVPADYKLIASGQGRFFFDMWLTDNTVNPPLNLQLQPLVAFIVTPSAILPGDPTTAPMPTAIIGYGLPAVGPTGTALYSPGGGALAWGNASVLGYSAARASSWTGAAPATIGAALDRLAAACATAGVKP